MTAPVPAAGPTGGSTRRRDAFLVLVAAAVLAFYAWAVSPGSALWGPPAGTNDYYNLLVRGFRAGHLYLPAEPPPGLLGLADPYDPVQNAPFGMHDVSLYHGRFYLYFGVAPALVLFGPVALVTGHALADRQAVLLFCAGAFLIGAAVLVRVRRRYFPAQGWAVEAAAVAAFGWATMVPVLLRRPAFYEVAVASGFFFCTAAWAALYHSLHGGRRAGWLAVASACYGLAVASRPTYAVGAAALLAAAGIWAWRAPARPSGSLVAAALLPLGLVGAGLAAYNTLRFGSPLEFGQRFALSGSEETRITHFSLGYLGFNARAYLWAPARLSWYFPFVRPVALPALPAGHSGFEDPYGILPNLPFALLAGAAPLAWRGRPALRRFCLLVAAASLGVATVVFLFQFASYRYMVDFLPGVIVLAVIGFYGGVARSRRVGAAGGALLAWSITFSLLAAVGHNELLRLNDPAVFRRLAHAAGWPRLALDRMIGNCAGPLELTLQLPADRVDALEPLVITGSGFLSDYLYAFYRPDRKLVIGFEHTSHGGPSSLPLTIDPTQLHRLVVDMPPLYPPITDPYFDGLPPGLAARCNHSLRVWFDGEPILDLPQDFYPAFRAPEVGAGAADQRALGTRFSGRMVGVRRLDPGWAARAVADRTGPLLLALRFPVGAAGGHEPLVGTGSPGKADLLVVNYVDPLHVSLSWDHWGVGGPASAAIPIQPGRTEILEVRFGSFYPAAERPAGIFPAPWARAAGDLLVRLDGKTVFMARGEFYPAPPESIMVGSNAVGASSCVPRFSGEILSWIRADQKL